MASGSAAGVTEIAAVTIRTNAGSTAVATGNVAKTIAISAGFEAIARIAGALVEHDTYAAVIISAAATGTAVAGAGACYADVLAPSIAGRAFAPTAINTCSASTVAE